MLDNVPRRRRSNRMVLTTTTEEEEFTSHLERECAFVSCFFLVDTPSNGWCADRVEEIP
jgi:hypothetical protein